MFSLVKSFIKKILPKKISLVITNFILLKNNLYYRISLFFLKKKMTFKLGKKMLSIQKLENRQLITIEDIEQNYNIDYLFNIKTLLYHFPPIFELLNEIEFHLTKGIAIKYYGVILNDVRVIGGSNLILINEQKALYDIMQYDFQKKYRYTDEAILYYKDDHCLVKSNDSEITFNEAIFLGGNFSWNYYHLMFEILVKFKQIDILNLNIEIPILVDDICLKVPQYFELLSILNNGRRKIISINKGDRHRVNRLYYFSNPNFIPPNFKKDNDIKSSDVLYNLDSINYLRINLLPSSTKRFFPKRIYISRSKASTRRQFNENEVFNILKKYDFFTLYPEDYSITDQIAMFNNAEFIAGGSGAAFTNLIFCNKNCKVIIFAKNKIPFSGFSTIAAIVKAKLIYYTDKISQVDDMKDIHEAFYINVNSLNNDMDNWIKS